MQAASKEGHINLIPQNMKQAFYTFALLMLSACATVPVTGRKQLNLVNNDELMAMSFQQYDAFLKENKLSKNQRETARIKEIGKRIQQAVENFMQEKGHSELIADFQWEFNLVEDDTPNAWCMPGGKVVFYTGILPICQSDEGIATVMGHEIAHAIAQHGAERMSHELMRQAGGAALSIAIHKEDPAQQQLYMAAYGLGSQVGYALPFSRKHESESDEMGLLFMAMAGYNPEEAVEFWKRMSKDSAGAPPEFLSTHPSHDTRISDLKKWMPKAKHHYHKYQRQHKAK